MVANSQKVWLLLPMNVQSSSACSSMSSKSRTIRSLKRSAAVEAQLEPSRDRVAGMARDPGGRRNTHALDAQACHLVELPSRAAKPAVCRSRVRAERSPADGAAVPPHRRPDFVANEPWPTMLRPCFPRLSHPSVAHAIPSIAFIGPVYRRARLLVSPTISGVQLTDQQRPTQAPDIPPPCRLRRSLAVTEYGPRVELGWRDITCGLF